MIDKNVKQKAREAAYKNQQERAKREEDVLKGIKEVVRLYKKHAAHIVDPLYGFKPVGVEGIDHKLLKFIDWQGIDRIVLDQCRRVIGLALRFSFTKCNDTPHRFKKLGENWWPTFTVGEHEYDRYVDSRTIPCFTPGYRIEISYSKELDKLMAIRCARHIDVMEKVDPKSWRSNKMEEKRFCSVDMRLVKDVKMWHHSIGWYVYKLDKNGKLSRRGYDHEIILEKDW